jgi:hypothetical protein
LHLFLLFHFLCLASHNWLQALIILRHLAFVDLHRPSDMAAKDSHDMSIVKKGSPDLTNSGQALVASTILYTAEEEKRVLCKAETRSFQPQEEAKS